MQAQRSTAPGGRFVAHRAACAPKSRRSDSNRRPTDYKSATGSSSSCACRVNLYVYVQKPHSVSRTDSQPCTTSGGFVADSEDLSGVSGHLWRDDRVSQSL